jgi:hypothetical protein
VDAFTIMRIAGHSSVLVSQKYVHPSPKQWSEPLSVFRTLKTCRNHTSRVWTRYSFRYLEAEGQRKSLKGL